MGAFNTQKLLYGNTALIPEIASRLESSFAAEGFEVCNQPLINGGADISISKGGAFKAVLGMRSALKISLKPQNNGIAFDASVGIFGQQAVPTLIAWFYAWPVLITQIWGLVRQSKLDDKALAIAEEVISSSKNASDGSAAKSFCIGCGRELPEGAMFCPYCGRER